MAVGLGISMGYHRLHTHRGFKTSKLFEYFLAICGTLTLEGGPIFWVAIHRRHHQHSDQPLDPHTPRVSGFWAHIGWILFGEASTTTPRSCPATRPTSAETRSIAG
jgi:stearoyl-CoA desaturase (delta-9 desaturase)